MPSTNSYDASAFLEFGEAFAGGVGSWAMQIKQVSGAGTYVVKAHASINPADSDTPLDATAPTVAIINQTSRATIDGATGVASDGLYLVQADGAYLGLDLAITGTATVKILMTPIAG